MGKLDKLDQQVRSCRLCRLCRTRLNGVPGDGNESTEVLFIGEGPGFHEDREGKPFVGPAGQLLDELLGLAGLRRADVYITNVVKCRPPQNRDPFPDEIAACAPYLERQIAAIDPLLIVTLGRFSMGRFFPNDQISKVHGKIREVEGRVVMTMWHPAFALRSPEGKESIKADFLKLPEALAQARAVRAARQAPALRPPADLAPLIAEHLATLAPLAPAPTADPPANDAAAPTADEFAYLEVVTRRGRKRAALLGAASAPVPDLVAAPLAGRDAPASPLDLVAESGATIDAPEAGEAAAGAPVAMSAAPAPAADLAAESPIVNVEPGADLNVEGALAESPLPLPIFLPDAGGETLTGQSADVHPAETGPAPKPRGRRPKAAGVPPTEPALLPVAEPPAAELPAEGADVAETETSAPPPPAKPKKSKPESEVTQLSLFD